MYSWSSIIHLKYYILPLTYYRWYIVFFTGRNEFQAACIYAVPGIFFSESFAFKNMAQVSIAVHAGYFDPAPVCIRDSFYCACNFIIKARPSAMRVKFILA